MSSQPLMPSTDRPDSFSGGASRISFIRRFDPESLDWAVADEPGGPTLRFEFPVCERPGVLSASFNVCLHAFDEPITLTEAEFHRLRCYLMLGRLPDAGL